MKTSCGAEVLLGSRPAADRAIVRLGVLVDRSRGAAVLLAVEDGVAAQAGRADALPVQAKRPACQRVSVTGVQY